MIEIIILVTDISTIRKAKADIIYLYLFLIMVILMLILIVNYYSEAQTENLTNSSYQDTILLNCNPIRNLTSLYQDFIFPHHLDVSEIKILGRNATHTIVVIPTNRRVEILPTGSNNPFMGAGNMVFIERLENDTILYLGDIVIFNVGENRTYIIDNRTYTANTKFHQIIGFNNSCYITGGLNGYGDNICVTRDMIIYRYLGLFATRNFFQGSEINGTN